MRVAIIGTRNPTEGQYAYIRMLALSLVGQGVEVATGNADGIDNAAVTGACQINPRKLWVYLPWATYNSQYIEDYPEIHVLTYLSKAALTSVDIFHPYAKKLTEGARKLHARNYGIIKEPTVDAVIACPSEKGGGTAQGMRIAKAFDIPLFDITNDVGRHKLIEWLSKNNLLEE